MGVTEERIERIQKQVEVMEGFGNAALDISSELNAILQENAQMEQQIEFLIENSNRLRERLYSDENLDLPVDHLGGVIHVGDAVHFEGEIETVLSLCWNGACWEVGLLGLPEYKAPEDCLVVPKPLHSGADGVPIEVGDTVYCDDDPEPLKVVSLHGNNESYCTVGIKDSTGILMSADAPRLSHEKPEPADSWEKLEEDMTKPTSCLYFDIDTDPLIRDCKVCPHGEKQSGNPCWKNKHLDMLKRAKKLAGVE